MNNGSANPEPMGVWAVCARTGDYDYVHTNAVPLENNTTATLIKQCPNGEDVTGGGVDNSGTDPGSEVGGTFPTTDGKSWTGAASNENTGANATMQVFAICLVPKVRSYIGPVETGGSVSFRAKLVDGKPRRILKKLEFDNVPMNCDQGATTHSTTLTDPLPVKEPLVQGDRQARGRVPRRIDQFHRPLQPQRHLRERYLSRTRQPGERPPRGPFHPLRHRNGVVERGRDRPAVTGAWAARAL